MLFKASDVFPIKKLPFLFFLFQLSYSALKLEFILNLLLSIFLPLYSILNAFSNLSFRPLKNASSDLYPFTLSKNFTIASYIFFSHL